MKRAVLVGLMAMVLLSSANALEIPDAPSGRISDFAQVLSIADRDQIETKLHALEQGTTRQIAFALFASLDEESLEDFSIRLAEKWKIGGRKSDDGVLVTAFLAEHKIRIEVGYGLEDKLTDAISSRIIREKIAPRFRSQDYAGGLNAGIDAIALVANGGQLPSVWAHAPVWVYLLLAIFAVVFVGVPIFFIGSAAISTVRSIRMLGLGGYLKKSGGSWLRGIAGVFAIATFATVLIGPKWISLDDRTNFMTSSSIHHLLGPIVPDGAWATVEHYQPWFLLLIALFIIEVAAVALMLVAMLVFQIVVPALVVGVLVADAIRGRDRSPTRRLILIASAIGVGGVASLYITWRSIGGLSGGAAGVATIMGFLGILPEGPYQRFRAWLDKKSKERSSGFMVGGGGWLSGSSFGSGSSSGSSFSGGGGSFGGGGASGSW